MIITESIYVIKDRLELASIVIITMLLMLMNWESPVRMMMKWEKQMNWIGEKKLAFSQRKSEKRDKKNFFSFVFHSLLEHCQLWTIGTLYVCILFDDLYIHCVYLCVSVCLCMRQMNDKNKRCVTYRQDKKKLQRIINKKIE